ncbi:MAG: hypothetical protein PHE72_14825 [candidate division Zixibacteria bacterium]|nr:hypothetical protein [candidate division Zixibacteria bacterium]
MSSTLLGIMLAGACVFAVTPPPAETPIDPFPSFPKTAIRSAPGEHVLTPSVNWQEDASAQGAEKITFIFYNAKMNAPGDARSDVAFTFDGVRNIPNYMIVPLSPGQKAKAGDVLLTWWQSGSGMQRAYVTDASDPAAPVVRYLDLQYDNPAKNAKGVPIGQMEERLKPDTFGKLTAEFQPGTAVAVLAGTRWLKATVIAVSEGQVLTIGFAGKMAVYPQTACRPVPIVPAVAAGDRVQVPYVGSFVNGVVKSVDAKIGRVFAEIEWGGEEEGGRRPLRRRDDRPGNLKGGGTVSTCQLAS